MIFSESSSAARRPTSGLAPAPNPLVSLTPSCSLTGACDSCKRLHVGVGDDELDAFQFGGNHAIDGVAPAAAHAYDFDLRSASDFVVVVNADFVGRIHRVLLRFFWMLSISAICDYKLPAKMARNLARRP